MNLAKKLRQELQELKEGKRYLVVGRMATASYSEEHGQFIYKSGNIEKFVSLEKAVILLKSVNPKCYSKN